MYLSLFVLIGALAVSIQWFIGIRRMPRLDNEFVSQKQDGPSVSVIVAARNEERDIYATVSSLLAQSWKDVEVIVVNDRSTDQTAAFLDHLKKSHHQRRRLKILTITTLPDGWLGKNHAMYQGYQLATGQWLLFTDADVTFDKHAVTRAMNHAGRNVLDHLTLIPKNKGGTLLYRSFHAYWSILGIWNFIQLKHAGIGAFNLVRKSVYEQAGTHRSLALSPDDDLKLGKQIVKKGFRQQLGLGNGLIAIQWYASIPQVIRGLEKNLFAFMRYNTALVILFSLILILTHVLPFIGVWFREPLSALFFILTLIIYFLMYSYNQVRTGISKYYFFLMPVNGLLFTWALLRSCLKTLRHGAVSWRGTTYKLSALKQKK